MYYFFDQGRQTAIRTKVSHGSDKDVGTDLLAAMKRQMRLDSLGQLRDFVSCKLTEEGYRAHLRSRGLL